MINNNDKSVKGAGMIKYQNVFETKQIKKTIPLTKNNIKIDI